MIGKYKQCNLVLSKTSDYSGFAPFIALSLCPFCEHIGKYCRVAKFGSLLQMNRSGWEKWDSEDESFCHTIHSAMIIDYSNFQNVLRQLRSPKHRRTGASAEHVLRSGVRRQGPSGLRPATRCHVLHQSASSGEPVGARPGGEDWQQDGYLFELLEGT